MNRYVIIVSFFIALLFGTVRHVMCAEETGERIPNISSILPFRCFGKKDFLDNDQKREYEEIIPFIKNTEIKPLTIPIQVIPSEIWQYICNFMTLTAQHTLLMTCQHFKKLLIEHNLKQ